MIKQSEVPVLIIGYQRTESVVRILESALSNGVTQVFISIDAPKITNKTSSKNLMEIRKIVGTYEEKFDFFKCRFLDLNLGCALHVLSSIDWAFGTVENLIILEDDCIPSSDFFQYAIDGLQVMQQQPEVALVCGTQHIPSDLSPEPYFKSKYSLTWGWATCKASWEEIKIGMRSSGLNRSLHLFCFDVERIYWYEGSRRAYDGFVDVWDTPLVNYLQTSQKFSLLPRENLITNIGNDSLATHTSGPNIWLFKQTGAYTSQPLLRANHNTLADEWLARNFYQIRFRHLLTTRFTRFRDSFKKASRERLLIRWIV